MESPVVKAWMPISVAGSKTRRFRQGFTLLELLVVLMIIGVASVGVSLSLPDPHSHQLELEALRLSAMLESGRAESRARGRPIYWRPTAQGFEFIGAAVRNDKELSLAQPRQWLAEGVSARILQPLNAQTLLLGPEALLPVQSVVLSMGDQRLEVRTDGLRPFGTASPEGAGS